MIKLVICQPGQNVATGANIDKEYRTEVMIGGVVTTVLLRVNQEEGCVYMLDSYGRNRMDWGKTKSSPGDSVELASGAIAHVVTATIKTAG